MTLDSGQRARLSLGGTQSLPVPGPAIARIRWAPQKGKKRGLVEILFERTPTHAVAWLVHIDDLKAIEQKNKIDAKKKKIRWRIGAKIVRVLNRAGRKGVTGVAYVREEAQTLLRLEHGATAIDSAQIVASGSAIASRESDAAFEVKCKSC